MINYCRRCDSQRVTFHKEAFPNGATHIEQSQCPYSLFGTRIRILRRGAQGGTRIYTEVCVCVWNPDTGATLAAGDP